MKAENVTRIAKKVAKRGERAQKLSHKARQRRHTTTQPRLRYEVLR
jgi:hypothetical protein